MKENKLNNNDLNILRSIQNNPRVSQRELSKKLGFSLGKINYCLLTLKSKGLIKINNFKKNNNKLNYLYLLTPKGFVEKTNFEKPFKWNIEIGSIQFLAGVFSCEREILIASKQLGFELMLNYAHSWSEADLYLKNHVDKLAQIPTENSPAIIEYIARVQSLELFDDNKFDDIHVETQNLAQVMAKEIGKYKQSFFEKISDFGLNLTANFMLVRIHLLKFLAILPNLDHDKNGVEVTKIARLWTVCGFCYCKLVKVKTLIWSSYYYLSKQWPGMTRARFIIKYTICKLKVIYFI